MIAKGKKRIILTLPEEIILKIDKIAKIKSQFIYTTKSAVVTDILLDYLK